MVAVRRGQLLGIATASVMDAATTEEAEVGFEVKQHRDCDVIQLLLDIIPTTASRWAIERRHRAALRESWRPSG